ncbi:hypothetical protein [Methylobacterium sp. 10]|uniref:hypothetical protein n=1 Tax=Methylobacterium sp. 10 TaxID=1101191 RepID=UPI0018CC4EF8|nr:hypothetical protein [Methylobacterium sp. 10]
MLVHLNCVFGESHLSHIQNVLIPSIASATNASVIFNVIDYRADGLSEKMLTSENPKIEINWIPNTTGNNLGFAEGHNLLFQAVSEPSFIIINPDCILQEGAIDALLATFKSAKNHVGIVEGRQWPFEHPKEYDRLTHRTPWASGAFALINSEMYRRVSGMDTRYFLYLEDVDLSWRSWLAGFDVVYEPAAIVTHFSGGSFYRDDLVENEKYYSIRNFVLLMRKFFGINGEIRARSLLRESADQEVVLASLRDIETNFLSFQHVHYENIDGCRHIKVLGINRFHEIKQ